MFIESQGRGQHVTAPVRHTHHIQIPLQQPVLPRNTVYRDIGKIKQDLLPVPGKRKIILIHGELFLPDLHVPVPFFQNNEIFIVPGFINLIIYILPRFHGNLIF